MKLELGLFSYSYHLAFGAHEVFRPQVKMNLFEFMGRAAEMGLDGVQLDAAHLESTDDAYIDRLRSAAAEHGLYLEYGITGVDGAHLRRHLEIAARLEAAMMRTYLGFNPREKSVIIKDEVEAAVRALDAVAPQAQSLGVRIAVENHCDLTTDALLDLIQRVGSPSVGVCADLGNFMIHLENPVESVRKLAPFIINTHFKDYAFTMENWGFKAFGVALGDGMIDLQAILEILVTESRLDRIMLEVPVEKEATEDATLAKEDDFVRRSVLYARDVLGIR